MNVEQSLEIKDILESITDGFFAVDANFNITYFNQAAERMLQCKRADVLNKNLWDCFPGSREGKYYAYYYYSLSEQVSVHFEELYKPMNMWNSVSVYPKKDGLSVYFIDITRQHDYIEKIEQQNEQLKSISWSHSHEVRAPLTNILGLIGAFNKENTADPENLKILNFLGDAAERLDVVLQKIISQGKEV